MPCFMPGTTIATPMGERAVEDLRPGDRVVTRDHGIREVVWTGTSKHEAGRAPAPAHTSPVFLEKGSLGTGLPERDMMVSPHQRIIVSGKRSRPGCEAHDILVPARHLVNGDDIRHVEPEESTFVHIMFARSEVVLANGCWAECFQPADPSLNGFGDAQRAELFDMFPELAANSGIHSTQ